MPRISSLAFHGIRCEAFAIFCSTTEGVFNNRRRLSFIHVPVKLEILCAELLSNFPGGWGHLITFLARGGGNLKKHFPKIQMLGGLSGGGGGC